MPNTSETIIVLCVILIILASSHFVPSIYCSNVGKVFILAGILLLAYRHLWFGVAGVILYIYLNYTYKEGMENMESSSEDPDDSEKKETTESHSKEENQVERDEEDPKTAFLKQCKDGKLYDDKNNLVDVKDISTVFPNLKFTGEPCNPCDSECGFTITTSSDRLATEESVRPVDSTTLPENPVVKNTNPVEPTQIK